MRRPQHLLLLFHCVTNTLNPDLELHYYHALAAIL
jgi:hypothetical protein